MSASRTRVPSRSSSASDDPFRSLDQLLGRIIPLDRQPAAGVAVGDPGHLAVVGRAEVEVPGQEPQANRIQELAADDLDPNDGLIRRRNLLLHESGAVQTELDISGRNCPT
jgi:hypothetical protein